MKTAEVTTPIRGKTHRTGAYVVPLAASLPSLLGLVPAGANPVDEVLVAEHVSHSRAALSDVGLILDRRIADTLAHLRVVLVQPQAVEDLFFERMPKSSRQMTMRVERRVRNLSLSESVEEIDSYLAADGW